MYFLYYTNLHGVIQNPLKFKWGQQEIEYLGFWIKKDRVQPTQETLRAIQEFPRPKDITGIRSWFGLIEQVSFAFSKKELMEPFRSLLSKNAVFSWTPELQKSFEIAKNKIRALVAE